MKYISTKEAAKKWGISDRRVRIMCSQGRIEGAIKLDWSWAVPEDTEKPSDGRALRHMKNRYLRLGNIDLDKLEELKKEIPFSSSIFNSQYGELLIYENFLYSFHADNVLISGEDILDTMNRRISHRLKFEELLLISNVHSIYYRIFSFFKRLNKHSYDSLLASIFQGMEYDIQSLYSEEKALKLEVLYSQYEMDWKNLHPIFKAILVYTELIKIKPLARYNTLVSLLVFMGIITDAGYLPVKFSPSLFDEINATLALVNKRGNYQDFALIIERLLLISYQEVKNV